MSKKTTTAKLFMFQFENIFRMVSKNIDTIIDFNKIFRDITEFVNFSFVCKKLRSSFSMPFPSCQSILYNELTVPEASRLAKPSQV